MLLVRGRPFDEYLDFKMALYWKLIFLPCDAEFVVSGPLLGCGASTTCIELSSSSTEFSDVLNSRLDL